MTCISRTPRRADVGHLLWEILDHLARTRRVQWPISLAIIEQQHQMLLQTIKDNKRGGVVVHDPRVVGALEISLCCPVHLLLVDRDTIHRTGRPGASDLLAHGDQVGECRAGGGVRR